MRTSVVVAVVLATLVAAGVVYAAVASSRDRIPTCSSIRVSGGDFNGLTGGTVEAAVQVRNLSSRDCKINGRPWIRLGPTRHAVTVADATPGMFGPAGALERVVRLRPRQHAVAQVFISPGSCSRAQSTVFRLRARAGWAERSVWISNWACKNGSGEIWVGSFER